MLVLVCAALRRDFCISHKHLLVADLPSAYKLLFYYHFDVGTLPWVTPVFWLCLTPSMLDKLGSSCELP